jgi:hypothetical protein
LRLLHDVSASLEVFYSYHDASPLMNDELQRFPLY